VAKSKKKTKKAKRLLKDTKLVRKTWGGVKPYQRVEKSQKTYSRKKKHKRIPINEEE
jgi:hypothetical protein